MVGKKGEGYITPNRDPITTLMTMNISHAMMAMSTACSHPVWKLALKTQIQAINASTYPKTFAVDPMSAPKKMSTTMLTMK